MNTSKSGNNGRVRGWTPPFSREGTHMPVIGRGNVLSGLKARDAMRTRAVYLPGTESIAAAVRHAIKFKVNALLVTGEDNEPLGIVSKTDIMGAYYAGLPIDSPVETIMVGPPLFCGPDDSLESALETMREHRIHRLFVESPLENDVPGVLAYPDIVGMLYRYCHHCKRNVLRARESGNDGGSMVDSYRVGEIMTPGVRGVLFSDTITQAIEELSAHRMGALLVNDRDGSPVGVLSKTDLALSYLHDIGLESSVSGIMTSPVKSCSEDTLLIEAVKKMIFSDVHRYFIHGSDPRDVTGVFTLTDAARIRSGSCRACVTTRIELEKAGG